MGQTDRPTDRLTDRQTDGPTDKASYRSSLPELKTGLSIEKKISLVDYFLPHLEQSLYISHHVYWQDSYQLHKEVLNFPLYRNWSRITF